jgi:hypothetical protein
VFYESRGVHRGRDEIDRVAGQARSRLLTLTFDISQVPGPRNWAMAGGYNGYLAAPVRRQLTPGLISSLPGTAGLRPFISFSTSCGELDSAVRRTMRRIGNGSSSDNTRPLDCTGGSVITLRGRRAGGLLPHCYQDRTN